VGSPLEARLYVGDFSGSVLDDPVAPLHFRALVELACAFLHAYKNESTLTDERLATLAPLFDIVMKHFGPDDITAFWTYITAVFENGAQMCATLMQSVAEPTREVYMTLQQQWLADGRTEGRKEGHKEGRKEGRKEGHKEGHKEGRKEGRTEGYAEAVLEVLESRALVVPAPVRERVLSTRDEQQLRRWLARASTVASAEELLGLEA
jgi:hypothetical protein